MTLETAMTGERFFETGEARLRYIEWLGDSPPFLFLHGVGAGLDYWFDVVDVRGASRAYAYDHRGHNGSSHVAGRYHYSDYRDDAVAFIERVIGEPAVLVTHSLGANIGLLLAADHPDLVRALVIEDPPLYVPEKGLRDDRARFEQTRDLAGRSVEEIVAAGLPEARAHRLTKLDPDTYGQLLDGTAPDGFDPDALLASVSCPMLLLHGERTLGSALYEGEVERAVQSSGERLEVVPFSGVGHLIHVEQPVAFKEAVKAFLERASLSQGVTA